MKTVSTADLASRVARELSAPEPQTRAVLDAAIDVMKRELQRGNCIDLPQFISLQVKQGQPVESTTQAGGTLGLPASRMVQLSMDENLRKAIEGSGLFQILLVVPRRNFFTNAMASRLASARSEVTIVEGVSNALELQARSRPDLIVLDVGLADANKIPEAVKKNRETSLTAVIAIYGDGADPNQTCGLTMMPDEQIVEPFELTDLVKMSESVLARFAEERAYFEHVMRFRLQTQDDAIEGANDLINGALKTSGLPEEAAQAFGVAFREALDNAARHGNKSSESSHIDVEYIVDREKATLTVQDEGDGFDTEIYLSRGVSGNPVDAARERYQAGGHGGLGIMLMLKCVDKIEYNYAGNKITLTRYIRK
jgi:anti-sigma regulatory factor (Ser/Thr protein kinase)/nucleoid DNA-binding protein